MRQTLAARFRRFLQEEDGPTAVEYAVLLALIATVCLAIVSQLGGTNSRQLSRVNRAMRGATRIGD